MTETDNVHFGIVTRYGTCCGKPWGCNRTDSSCVYRNHRTKRALLFGDTTAPCQARSISKDDAWQMKCSKTHGHELPHDMIRDFPNVVGGSRLKSNKRKQEVDG